jgi:lipopolysaccharide transport system permease protein
MNKSLPAGETLTMIKPKSGWDSIDFHELKHYKDLIFFLVWRDIKVMYAQTILGFSWAVLQPLIQVVLFTIVFGKVAKVSSDNIPYVLFSTVAIIPWTYMSTAMSQSSECLIRGQNMLGKVYFPRLIFPITSILARLLDFFISIIIILIVLLYYHVSPTLNLLFLPLFFVLMVMIPAGVGMWLSALAIRFRDVKYAMRYLLRLLIYTAPIVYSASAIPGKYRLLYSINPIVAVIEGYRSCLLGTPMPWGYIWPGILANIILLVSGALYFKRMEKIFVDVI